MSYLVLSIQTALKPGPNKNQQYQFVYRDHRAIHRVFLYCLWCSVSWSFCLFLSPLPPKHYSSLEAQVKLHLLMKVYFLTTPSLIPSPSKLRRQLSCAPLPVQPATGVTELLVRVWIAKITQLHKLNQNQVHKTYPLLVEHAWDNQRKRLLCG